VYVYEAKFEVDDNKKKRKSSGEKSKKKNQPVNKDN
jgi:hypothetical protein